ncbi:MAG TPA: ABC transporter permease [Acidimicrobiia bacterium]|jgi:peptide/nickel transport system permease protein
MGRFLLKRILQGAIVVIGVTVVVFVVTRLIGDPVRVMLPLEATAEQRAAFAAQLGFDRPLYVQFFDFIGSALRFDFGNSLWQDRPALEIVLEALPRTLLLVGASMVLAVIIAIPLGILTSLKPGGFLDRLLVTLSLTGLSMPNFWLGLLLIVIFGVQLQIFPIFGSGTLMHAVLPAVTFALPSAARLVMLTRSAMIDELNKSYVALVKAKNVPFRRLVGAHAFRNAAVPVMTMTGWEIIRALAGYSVVVETVFAWPGLGFLAIQSITRQDLILLQAIVFVVALMIITINILMDLAYKYIDPRIKLT